jgi:hypothetical protein
VAVCGANEGGLLDIVASRKTTKDAFTPDRLELRMDGGDRWLMLVLLDFFKLWILSF